MGVLKDRCEKFLEELKSSVAEMDELTEKIKATDPWEESFDVMYEREFMLAVKTVGIFEDLHINLERLDKEDLANRFFTNRVRKEADGLVKFGYIELGGGDVH